MLGFGYNLDPELKRQFAQEWNNRLHSVRVAGFIISILMIAVGVLCMIFPMQSLYAAAIIMTVFILAFGIFEIVEYASLPIYFRMGGLLASGIMNIIVGFMLLTLPAEGMVMVFAFLLAFDLLMMGIEELSFSSLLRFVAAESYGWVIANGVLNLIFGFMLLFIPLQSSVALWFVIAIYLVAGGITLLIECIKSKDLEAQQD